VVNAEAPASEAATVREELRGLYRQLAATERAGDREASLPLLKRMATLHTTLAEIEAQIMCAVPPAERPAAWGGLATKERRHP
jgi:hypothetical protein